MGVNMSHQTSRRFSYVNCNRDRFFLHVRQMPGKQVAYFMAKSADGALAELPADVSVREHPSVKMFKSGADCAREVAHGERDEYETTVGVGSAA